MKLTDFNRIVLMNTLTSVGMGLVGVFVPIYLLELGYPLFSVVMWLLTHHLSLLVAAYLVVFVANRIGLVRAWYIRAFLVAILFWGLAILPDKTFLLFPLAIFSGFESAFFWIPYNILIVRKTNAETMGSSLAFINNVMSAVGIFVPGMAALLITVYGYPILFATALFFITVSLIPVLALRSEKTHFKFEWNEIKKIAHTNRHFIVPEILDNLGQDAGIIWTLFIFITGLTVLDIGALGVIVGIVSMIVTYIAGYLIDNWNIKAVVRLGAIGTTITWLGSYLIAVYAPTPFMLYFITALRGLALGIFVAAYGVVMFNRARGADAQFLVLRETPTIIGRVIVFIITLLLVSANQFELTFLLVALISIYFWFNNLDRLISKA